MRQMLSSLQESPLVGMFVLVIFSLMFGYILFEALRRKNKQAFEEAGKMPLEDVQVINSEFIGEGEQEQ